MTILLGFSCGAVLLLLLIALINGQYSFAATDAVGALLLAGLLAAHLRGFRWTAQVMVSGTILLMLGTLPPNPTQRDAYAFNVMIPMILAAVLLPWYWCVAAFVVCLSGMAVLWGGTGLLFQPAVLVSLCLQAGGIALASVVARAAQRKAEANAERLQAALEGAEAQKLTLAEQTQTLQTQNEQQRQLLDLVTTLEVPAVTLASGVLLTPVVGALDSRRAQALTNRLLEAVSEQHARLVVLDIAGMTTIDTAVAKALIDAVQAVRLLGCDVVISGISAAVATTLTHLNISLGSIKSARSPQDALQQYRHLLGASEQVAARGGPRYGNN
jgi:anti-anti-sigma regulatory factor